MYESRTRPLISRAAFMRRLAAHGGIGLATIVISLIIGVFGYHGLAGLAWIDAILNACMIMGGMGPIDRLETTAAKLFASVYALYSGLILLVSVGFLFTPIFHRILHRFHLENEKSK